MYHPTKIVPGLYIAYYDEIIPLASRFYALRSNAGSCGSYFRSTIFLFSVLVFIRIFYVLFPDSIRFCKETVQMNSNQSLLMDVDDVHIYIPGRDGSHRRDLYKRWIERTRPLQ